jgi:predicted regulator of Ras-like GTPase activity (Roadblock/LC7/MglB family)
VALSLLLAFFDHFPGCMFRFLRNLLSKKSSSPIAVPVPRATAVPVRAIAPGVQPRAVEGVTGVQRVETAQLQLLAIMSKFPDDLRKLVTRMPPEHAMVVMPIPAILRFLPTGSVKMSLASVVRQAPPGTFSSINPQDKRLVEVPLAEIFKRVSPAILKRRDDQRFTDLAADGFDIFGDDENPYNLAPRVEEEPEPPTPEPPPAPAPVIPQPRVLQMPPGMVTAPPPSAAPPKRVVSPPTQPLAAKPRVAVPPTPFVPPPNAVPQAPSPAHAAPLPPIDDGQPPLVLPLQDIFSGWPEPIRSEAAALNGTTVSLPSGQVGVGLARGKVAFNWGQIRAWMTPPPTTPTEASDSIELLLPLRVIAPAFLKHSRGGGVRKSAALGEEIPELFAGRGPAAPAAPFSVPPAAAIPTPPSPVAEIPKAPPVPTAPRPAAPAPANEIPESLFTPVRARGTPARVSIPEPEAPVAPLVREEPPAAEEPPPAPPPFEPSAPFEAEIPEPSPVEQSAPPLAVAPVTAASAAEPQSLAEAFNQPGKQTWSPSEIINYLAQLPEIAGSVVALQEGLVVAHRLPDPLKGEVFAAFLPQIFARINQYSNEMKLGAVDDLLINAHGLPCHLFRVGQVYFAALGKPGIPLPTPILRLCAAALAS